MNKTTPTVMKVIDLADARIKRDAIDRLIDIANRANELRFKRWEAIANEANKHDPEL